MNTLIELNFGNPVAWFRQNDVPGIQDVTTASNPGIYLWTVQTDSGELVYYVGETGRSFVARMAEHLTQQLSGMYHIYEPESFRNGVKHALWRGAYGQEKEPSGVAGFLDLLPTIAPSLASFVRLMRFRLAPLDAERRLRERIEVAIALHLKDQPDPIGSFQEEGVRYRRRLPDEVLVTVTCRADGVIFGLPASLDA
ncbi:MAG: GIY-YIG nuclease family protein [Anaerolineae bacterium]